MGFKKLSEQELTTTIQSSDELIAIVSGDLKKLSLETLISLLNTNFDVAIETDTDDEFVLKVNIGENTIITPNLRSTSVKKAEIIENHLIFTMTDGSTMDLGVVTSNYPQYGVCYDANTENPTLERVGAAVGLVAGIGVGSDTNIVNDFDNIYPWSDMKRCTMADNGTITAYEGDVNYVEDGSIGQVMVEIPKFYIKRITDKSTNKIYTYICGQKLSGYRVSEAFKDSNGDEIDKIYIGAFPCVKNDDGLINSFRQGYNENTFYSSYADIMKCAMNRGENWHNLDVREICDVIQPLMMVEFATLNLSSIFAGTLDFDFDEVTVDETSYSDEKKNSFITELEDKELYVGAYISIQISENDTDFTDDESDYIYDDYYNVVRKITEIATNSETGLSEITFDGIPILFDDTVFIYQYYFNGIANDIKASSGILGDGEEGYVPFKWRHFENLFNYDYVWMGGILYNNSSEFYRFNPDLKNQALTTIAQFETTDIKYPTGSGFISELANSENYPYITLPTKIDGSSDKAYCDEFNGGKVATISRALRWGLSGVFGFAYYSNYYSSSGRLAYHRF